MENSISNGSANGLSLPFYDLFKNATGPFGHVTITPFTGNGFHIYRIHFHIISSSRFIHSSSGINLIVNWQNELMVFVDEEKFNALSFHQYSFISGPFSIVLNKTGVYEALIIELSDKFLAPYIQLCPELLKTIPRFLTLDMICILNKAISFANTSEFASLFYESMVHELLTLISIQVALVRPVVSFPPDDLALATAVKKIIESDFELFPTIGELAQRVGITEIKLQSAFKYLYGQTVGKFSREARLQRGYELLSTTTFPLRVICEMVGYPDPSNFSLAFKKQYGFWPGKIQKNRMQKK